MISEKMGLQFKEAEDTPEVKDVTLSKETEEERDIHGDDGEQKRPEAEEVKKEIEDDAKKELNSREENVVNDINDAETPKAVANNGFGKAINIKGLSEKLTLEEPTDVLTEGYEDINVSDKIDFLINDMSIDATDLLEHMVEWIPYDELNDCINDYIKDNDLEDEFEFADVRENFFLENIPNDLVKAYKSSSTSKYADKPYQGRFGKDTDLFNSRYEEVSKEDAKSLYKQDPQSIMLLIDGDLVGFRENGKPSLELRTKYVDSSKKYIKSTGKEINDTRKMPLSHLLNIADKIYKVDEVEKDKQLTDTRKENPESPNYKPEGQEFYDGSKLPTTSSLPGAKYDRHRVSKRWHSKDQMSAWEDYLKSDEQEYRYAVDLLKELEDKYQNGMFSDEDYYQRLHDRYKLNVERRKDILDKDKAEYSGKIKDYKAALRYGDIINKDYLRRKSSMEQSQREREHADSLEAELSNAKQFGTADNRDKRMKIDDYQEEQKRIDKKRSLFKDLQSKGVEIEDHDFKLLDRQQKLLDKQKDLTELSLIGADEEDAAEVDRIQQEYDELNNRILARQDMYDKKLHRGKYATK